MSEALDHENSPDSESKQRSAVSMNKDADRSDPIDSSTLFRRLYQVGHAISSATDQASVGQALMAFAPSWDIHAARLIVFADFDDGHPTAFELREGWTVDDRPSRPYGLQLPLKDYPLLEHLDPDAALVVENIEQDERLDGRLRRMMARSGLGSIVIFPMTSNKGRSSFRWLGALIVGRDTPSVFDDTIIYAWWTLAGQAAQVLEYHRIQPQDTKEHILLNTPRSPVLSLDKDLTIRFCNDAYARLTGRSIEELEGQNLLKLYPHFGGSRLHASYLRTLETGETNVAEGRLGNRYIRARIYRTPSGVLWMIEDITAQKRAEVQQKQRLTEFAHRMAQLETVVEVSRAISSILDLDQLIEQIVEQIRERFDLYYVGLFMVDMTGDWTGEPNRWAVLRAGTGEAGRAQMQEGHKLALGSRSMIGWCVANAQARISENVTEETTRFINPFLPETRSEMALPLISRGQVLGAMTIQSTTVGAFSETDISILQNLADQLANAIHNAQLFEESSRRAEELSVLNRIVTTVSRSLDLQHMLDSALVAVIEALNFDAGLISLIDPETNQLYLGAHQGLPTTMARQLRRRGFAGTLCDVVFRSGDPMGIEDLRVEAPVDVSGLIKEGLNAYVGSPITYQTTPLGTFCLFGRSGRRANISQLPLLGAIGQQLGIGIQNAHLYQRAQQQLTDLAIIQETSAAFGATLSFEDIIDAMLPRISSAVHADTASLFVLEGETLTRVGSYAVDGVTAAELGQQISLTDYPLTRQVIESHQAAAVTTGDPRLQKHAREAFKAAGVSASATIPLVTRQGVLGTLAISLRQPSRAFSEREMNLLQTFADQAAQALQNARLIEEAQAHAHELGVLNEMGRALSGAMDVYTICDEIHRYTGYLMDATNLYVALYDATEDTVTFPLYAEGDRTRRLTEERRAGRGLTEHVIHNCEPLLIQADVAQQLEALGLEAIGRNAESWLGVPMIVGQELIGVIAVQSYTTPRLYDEHSRDLLIAVANQAAIALQNARLFEEMQRGAQREQALRQVVASIAVSEDLLASLPSITEKLQRLVPVDVLTLTSYTPGDSDFTLLGTGVQPEAHHFAERGMRSSLQNSAPGWVILHEQPWLETDFRHKASFESDRLLIKEGLASRLLLPLKIGENVIGTLNMASKQPAAFTKEDIPILSQVADQIALALERARLLEETRIALAEVQATHRRYVSEQWADTLSTGGNRVWGYGDGPTGLTPTEEIWTPEIEGAITSGELTVLRESTEDEEGVARSGLAVPIRLMGQIIGVLNFYDKDRVWTEDDEALVETLADQLALALENQRLFEQAHRRAQRERLTGEIVTRIRSADDVQSILQTAAKELGRALGVSRAFIQLQAPAGGLQAADENENGQERQNP